MIDSAFSKENYLFLLKPSQNVPVSSSISVIQLVRQATSAFES